MGRVGVSITRDGVESKDSSVGLIGSVGLRRVLVNDEEPVEVVSKNSPYEVNAIIHTCGCPGICQVDEIPTVKSTQDGVRMQMRADRYPYIYSSASQDNALFVSCISLLTQSALRAFCLVLRSSQNTHLLPSFEAIESGYESRHGPWGAWWRAESFPRLVY